MKRPRVWVEATVSGRLAAAYPAGRHDVELRLDDVTVADQTETLRRESDALLAGDPSLRKVIFAAHADDTDSIRSAEAAGFRYVVDVDVLEQGTPVALSLLVREPDFVTHVDMDLDRVPGS